MRVGLVISGIINILVSIIFTRFTGISLFYSIFPMITGIIFILFSYSENLKSKKQIILILSIFLLAVSPLSSFINLFFISEIDKEPKRSRSPNIDIDPEIKRIDILIKVGISLIILSCLIFIFSDWNIFNEMIVSIFLIIFTLIFYLLYKLFSIKIILPSSQKLYYILYNSFIVLTFLALGYYKFFGNYFSPLGLGKNIFYTVLLLVISIILNNVKKFTKLEYINYFILICLNLSLVNLLIFLDFSYLQIILILNIIAIVLNSISNNDYLKNYNYILCYLFNFLVIFNFYNSISFILLLIINFIFINYVKIKEQDDSFLQFVTPILSYIYIFELVIFINQFNYIERNIILCMLFMFCYFILNIFLNKNTLMTKRITTIFYNIAMFIFTLISFFLNFKVLIYVIIIRLLSLIFYKYFSKKYESDDVEYCIIPLNILMLSLTVTRLVSLYININFGMILLVLILTISIYMLFIKNSNLKSISFCTLFVLLIINTFSCIDENNIIIIILSILSLFIPLIESKLNNNLYFKYSFLLLIVLSYFILFNNIFDLYNRFLLNILIIFILYLLDNKKEYFKYLLVFIAFPIITLLYNMDLNIIFKDILLNISLYYILIVFIYNFIKDQTEKNIVFYIFSSIILLLLFYKESYIYGIYIGLISLILIIISNISDRFKKLFYYGIVILIINILYRLKDIWLKIPFWLYLLLAGLAIIIFATFKEIKKINKK